eukprot:COSAG06_NODE_122_length_23062_cov_43.568990_6_plen_856_part_00
MPRAVPLPGPPAAESPQMPQGAAGYRQRALALALWAGVALGYAALGLGLWWCLKQFYFGGASSCRTSDEVAAGWSEEAQWIDTILGALPILLRNCLLLWLLWKACRKLSGYESDEAHVARALLLGRGSALGNAPPAGWDAIVGPRGADSTSGAPLQSTWEQAREARRLTQQQAVSTAVAKALLWHASQPAVYLFVLRVYSCHVASLGGEQPTLAAVVAVREVLYLGSVALGAYACPVFLLLDPVTAWNETDEWLERTVRVAMYVLTPHNCVAFCLANRFRGWRRVFLGLTAVQVAADFASCFALATLLAGGITEQKDTPTALIIGYIITAFGFLLFFGPLSVASSLRGAADKQKRSGVRCALATAGISLLCALGYVVLLFVLLMTGEQVFCNAWTLQADACHGNGICYGAGQCHCDCGYGPEVSYSGEALCGQNHMPCSSRQLQKALEAGDDTCCFGHGTIAPGGCACDYGYGPEVSDTEALCARDHVPCTANQLQRALAAGDDTCCFNHGAITAGGCVCDYGYGPENGTAEALCSRRLGDHVPCTARQLQKGLVTGNNTCCFGHGKIAAGGCACDNGYGPEAGTDEPLCYSGLSFPGSRLIPKAGGDSLDGWMKAKVKGKQWSLCFSSFKNDATTPGTFHRLCDQHNTTLTVARNSLKYTFGGYVRLPPVSFRCCSVLFLVRFFRGAGGTEQPEKRWEGQKLAERQIALMPLLARCLSRLLAAPLPTTRFSRARYMSPGGPAILALLDFSQRLEPNGRKTVLSASYWVTFSAVSGRLLHQHSTHNGAALCAALARPCGADPPCDFRCAGRLCVCAFVPRRRGAGPRIGAALSRGITAAATTATTTPPAATTSTG